MKFALAALVMLPVTALAQTLPTSEIPPDSPEGLLLARGIVPPQPLPKVCSRMRPTIVPRPYEAIGATIIAYKVEPDGTVKDIKLVHSSGRENLDDNILKCATELKYKPATKEGIPVEVDWELYVAWGPGPKHS